VANIVEPAGADAAGTRVLVVDDEPMVCEVVSTYLTRDGHVVETATDGLRAMDLFSARHFDLVVLDLMLPELNGLEVLGRLRQLGDTPVIILSARGDEGDRVLGLELGADDYVVKPFSPRELAARVTSVLRRGRATPSGPVLRFGDLTVDQASREVHVRDRRVDLTRREFDLLAFLATSPRQVFTRTQLLEHVWDSTPEWQDAATVTVHIGHLRQKIKTDPANPHHLVTVRGVGYRFEP
jgi:DNA-binding response OmpR family regulator